MRPRFLHSNLHQDQLRTCLPWKPRCFSPTGVTNNWPLRGHSPCTILPCWHTSGKKIMTPLLGWGSSRSKVMPHWSLSLTPHSNPLSEMYLHGAWYKASLNLSECIPGGPVSCENWAKNLRYCLSHYHLAYCSAELSYNFLISSNKWKGKDAYISVCVYVSVCKNQLSWKSLTHHRNSRHALLNTWTQGNTDFPVMYKLGAHGKNNRLGFSGGLILLVSIIKSNFLVENLL